MPHRLRRVIGVNIRNPRDGGTSLRFAQLDTRGAVMAVGPNGVGKTSFLRLIPLFYGALPSRILRGSGHTSMVRHILPNATSAVVYEYERETEEQVRCVVMHAAPEAEIDAPVFHIISSGFEERFLTDEDGNFLRRDEFKSRVESFNIEVSQQLSLAQYRSVILNSVGLTKDAGKIRHLAVQHSLSPGTLHGLDQIAAAMGPEAISFQVLQEIVVDQVAMELSSDGKMTRELKKSAGDVMKWLDAYDHLAKLQGRAEDARTLSAHCAEVEETDNALRELRRAVSDLIASLNEQAEQTGREINREQAAGALEQERLAGETTIAHGTWQELRASATDLRDRIGLAVAKQLHFSNLDGQHADKREAEQAREESIRAEQSRLLHDQKELQDKAQSIVEGFVQRAAAVRGQLAQELGRISAAETELAQLHGDRMEELRVQEQESRENLKPPARIETAGQEFSTCEARANVLRGEQKNPAASAETQGELAAVLEKLSEARGLLRTAEQSRETARSEMRDSERARDDLLLQHQHAHNDVQAAQDVIAGLELQLRPPAGSLLAFMREARFAGRAQVAKVLAPELLKRTDLQPQELLDAPELPGAALAIGALALQLQEVPEPDWLEAGNSREQLQRAQALLSQAQETFKARASDLQAANVRGEKCARELAQRESQAGARSADVERLEAQERDLRRAVQEEVKARRAEILAELDTLSDQMQTLTRERDRLLEEHRQAGSRLTSDFSARRAGANQQRQETAERLMEERKAAQSHADGALSALADEEKQELAKADVPIERLEKLRGELATLGGRLASITRWRQEVDAWRVFRDGDLAKLPLWQEQLAVAERDRDDAQLLHQQALDAQERQAQRLSEHIAELERQQDTHLADVARLQALQQQELLVIGEPRAGRIVQTWSADELAMKVGKERRKLLDATTAVDGLHRSIRSQMLGGRDGPVQDWLLQREAELAPLLEGQPDHLATLQRGRLVGQWFEGAAGDAINALHMELSGVLSIASGFVTFLDTFDRKVLTTNNDLKSQLGNVKPFPSFKDLDVQIRSTVRELDYMPALRQMKALSESQVSMSRISGRIARQTDLPEAEVVSLMKTFRDLLNRDGGIRANLADLVRLECSLNINGKPLRIADADEFRKHASNGNTGMIIGMFLMGFAGVVRKRARARVRVTWITDEAGRFDAPNLQAFLKTLDENDIDVISARPEADPSTLDLFDTESRFGVSGKISTAKVGIDEWEMSDVAA